MYFILKSHIYKIGNVLTSNIIGLNHKNSKTILKSGNL